VKRGTHPPRRIQVVVHDSTVTLNGSVHAWAEKAAVLSAARFTLGVCAVEDHVYLEHPEEIRARDEHFARAIARCEDPSACRLCWPRRAGAGRVRDLQREVARQERAYSSVDD
jgi:hypothetical protein